MAAEEVIKRDTNHELMKIEDWFHDKASVSSGPGFHKGGLSTTLLTSTDYQNKNLVRKLCDYLTSMTYCCTISSRIG